MKFDDLRPITKHADGIGEKYTRSLAREFDSVDELEQTLDEFPESQRRLQRAIPGQDPPEYRVLDWVISLDEAFEEYEDQEGEQ